jgi:hypothetical protein
MAAAVELWELWTKRTLAIQCTSKTFWYRATNYAVRKHWRVTSKDPMTLVLCSNRLIVKPCEAKMPVPGADFCIWSRRVRRFGKEDQGRRCGSSAVCPAGWCESTKCASPMEGLCVTELVRKGAECLPLETCDNPKFAWQTSFIYLAPGLRHILTLRLHPCVFSFLQAALTGASAWILEETTGSMLAWNIQSEIIYLKDLTIGPHCTAASHLDISQSPTRWRRSMATRSKPKERQQMSSVVNNPWPCKYIFKKTVVIILVIISN